jgi:non-ribosomal peptide synthetase component F
VEPLIGSFVNTLALRTQLSGDLPASELIDRVRNTALAAYDHQAMPFERLIQELNPERDLSSTPLFNVLITFKNQPPAGFQVGDLLSTPYHAINTGTTNYDLTMEILNEADGFTCHISYRLDLFSDDTVTRLGDHFKNLLRSILENPSMQIAALPFLDSSEYRQLIDEWSHSDDIYPTDACVPQLFEAQVAETPDNTAAIDDLEQVTYCELNRRANRIAHFLAEQGIGPSKIVAVLANRSINYLATILGIFKAGGIYLPLDPNSPPQRHHDVILQSGSPVIVLGEEFADAINAALHEVRMEKEPPTFVLPDILQAESREDNLPVLCHPEDVAYVLFTSGST